MRGSLWPGMLQVAAANLARQQERIRIFEIGTSFHGTLAQPREVQRLAGLATGPVVPEQWGSDRRNVDFFDIKSDIDALLSLTGDPSGTRYEPAEHPALQPGQPLGETSQGGLAFALTAIEPGFGFGIVFRPVDLRA